eukprot:TRINITY_DN37977_c0_g1_i1.p1 TRINITY_DN37977_c0_g1~~TRINITY_DN37977_c0_g1_i1.p1  ORF type:complete len:114 (+),score=18.34 TRINITY_DN37977_c0_g1_i1:68-409(+)
MKDKPVKFGIKLWVLADAKTAYCYNMEVYTGKHGQQVNKLLGLSARVVIGLTKPVHNCGHIVFTDNFYLTCARKIPVEQGDLPVWHNATQSYRLPTRPDQDQSRSTSASPWGY